MTKDEFLKRVMDIFDIASVDEHWYCCQQLGVFGNKTPKQMVDEGRAKDLLRYLESLTAGFLG